MYQLVKNQVQLPRNCPKSLVDFHCGWHIHCKPDDLCKQLKKPLYSPRNKPFRLSCKTSSIPRYTDRLITKHTIVMVFLSHFGVPTVHQKRPLFLLLAARGNTLGYATCASLKHTAKQSTVPIFWVYLGISIQWGHPKSLMVYIVKNPNL